MKAKVIKRFKDKYTGERYKVNRVLEISKERFDEILTVDKLVEEIKEEVKEEAPKKKTTKKASKKSC